MLDEMTPMMMRVVQTGYEDAATENWEQSEL